MQTAKIPWTVCDSIYKKTRKFIWGGNEHKEGLHLISWETLQKPKHVGEIGIRPSKQANADFWEE